MVALLNGGGGNNETLEQPRPAAVVSRFPSESTHWYLADGSPFYTVKAASGDDRPVTLRDARKVKAVPSVTTILKSVAAPALENYKANEILKAAWDMIREADFDGWCKGVIAGSREHARKAAEVGTALHAALEGSEDTRYTRHFELVCATMAQYCVPLSEGEFEHSFAHPLGFGGKVDWHRRDNSVVIDYKTKAEIVQGKRLAYDNHCMQLAAYRHGLGLPEARCINVFVGVEPPCVVIHEWPEKDLERGWRMFELILKFWQEQNNYKP